MVDPQQSPSARASALAGELRTLVATLKRRLREQANVGDLTPSQQSALLRLEKMGEASTSDLARAEGMRPQSMATIIAALETEGLVSGSPDSRDGRRVLLSLTEACRHRLQEGRAVRHDWLSRQLEARLSLAEMDVVATAVRLLGQIVDD